MNLVTYLQKKSQNVTGITQTSLIQTTVQSSFRQQNQLLKKFQLAHLAGFHAMSFSSYQYFAKFEREIHGVDIGSGYTDRT